MTAPVRHEEQHRLRIAVSGASGLIGTALMAHLRVAGHEPVALVRPGGRVPGIAWDPQGGTVDLAALERVDVVVHLAGENVGQRWNDARRHAILHSRVDGTTTLAKAMAALTSGPRVLISASAVGYYGDTGDREVDESAAAGQGFLAEVCQAWEQAADPARQAGIRVVHPRLGVVMSAQGGALPRMLPAFRLGGGGPIGTGHQGFPWVALDDVLAALTAMATDARMAGPVNVVGPELLSQREVARALGEVLHRPSRVPMPASAVSLLFGQMGREVLLAGQFVRPRRLLEVDFQFQFDGLEALLQRELGKARLDSSPHA